jgi:hypothetical protein
MKEIKYLSPLRPDFLPVPIDKCHWRIVVPFRFSIDEKVFETPPNMLTDFASVPRVVWVVMNPYELGVGPVPHDMGYQTGAKSKGYWDSAFAACMEKDRVPAWKRCSAYHAVHIFGFQAWNEYRKGKIRRTKEVSSDMSFARNITPQESAWAQRVFAITAEGSWA